MNEKHKRTTRFLFRQIVTHFSYFPFQILRNLLTNDPNNEATDMGSDQVKAVCLFFQMCLESNFDDGNAIKLLGLLLIKFYNEQVRSLTHFFYR